MRLPNIIFFAGCDGNGKSTLAKNWVKFLAPHIEVPLTAFATGVREKAIADGLLTREEAYAKPTSEKARRVLREVGGGEREKDPDVWVKAYAKDYGGLKYRVNDDTRYVNEATMAIGECALLVYVKPEPGTDTSQWHTMSSFRELPEVEKMAHIVLPWRPKWEEFLCNFGGDEYDDYLLANASKPHYLDFDDFTTTIPVSSNA
jgi:hypothetical protein